LRHNDIVMLGL